MCWPFVIERCLSTAPIYFTALMFGLCLFILLTGEATIDAVQIVIVIGPLFLFGIVSAAANVGQLPEPFGSLVTGFATGIGYFAHLVAGPLVFAGVTIITGAVTTAVTHSLIGEYV